MVLIGIVDVVIVIEWCCDCDCDCDCDCGIVGIARECQRTMQCNT